VLSGWQVLNPWRWFVNTPSGSDKQRLVLGPRGKKTMLFLTLLPSISHQVQVTRHTLHYIVHRGSETNQHTRKLPEFPCRIVIIWWIISQNGVVKWPKKDPAHAEPWTFRGPWPAAHFVLLVITVVIFFSTWVAENRRCHNAKITLKSLGLDGRRCRSGNPLLHQ